MQDAEQNGIVHIMSRTVFDYEAKKNNFFMEVQAIRWAIDLKSIFLEELTNYCF